MLLSPLFMLLYSAALISLVFRGFGWRIESGSTGLRLDLLVGSGSVTTYLNICGMYCTGFHSHSASQRGTRPRCGGDCLAGRPPICWSSISLLLQAVVRCSSLSNVDTFFFCRWSNRSKAPPKLCLYLIPPPSQDFFPLDLGRERLRVGILKGRYANFY